MIRAICVLVLLGSGSPLCALAVEMTKEPMKCPISAVAGKEYTGQLAEKGPYKITAPKEMKVSEDGKLSWTPTHENAPYTDVKIDAGGKPIEFKIHVVGIPDKIQKKMKALNQEFKGADYSFTAFGDSISDTEQWVIEPAKLADPGLSPHWNIQSGYVFIPKGFGHCNGAGWTTATPLGKGWGDFTTKGNSIIEDALQTDKPEVATIQFGTNDSVPNGGHIPVTQYRKNMEKIIDITLQHKCVPILCVPSRNGAANVDITPYLNVVREVGIEKEVPILDIDMIYQSHGTLKMFWKEGNAHPSFKNWQDKKNDLNTGLGYGVSNRHIYFMYRHLIDLGVIDAPKK